MRKYIKLNCGFCNAEVIKDFNYYKNQIKRNENYKPFCSRACVSNYQTKKISVNCFGCNILVVKTNAQFKESIRHFCTSECSNKHRLKNTTKIVHCSKCNETCELLLYSSSALCYNCRELQEYWKPKKPTKKLLNCISCPTQMYGFKDRKYCDDCLRLAMSKGGRNSAAAQGRRSKNEIHFADLCIQKFTHVLTNEPIFESKYGNWDADVIIPEFKVAILWNGAWHYEQIHKGSSVKQVQARDKIKLDVIESNGYISYIIKDMGKHNKTFVQAEFNKFCDWLDELNVIAA